MSKREIVLKAFNNEAVERVPVGFWFHFVVGDEFNQGVEKEAIVQKNIAGHKKFVQDFQPDFVKLMSDGFFAYPNKELAKGASISELKKIEPIGEHHPWIEKQVKLVKELTYAFGEEVATFYNIFAPATYVKFLLKDSGKDVTIEDYFKEDRETLRHVLDVIAEDIKVLSRRVITEGKADGIYLSVQNLQDKNIKRADYLEIIAPSERKVLDEANKVSENNILHICGYEGVRNDLSIYVDYPAKAVNWAVTIENVSLEEGKKLFDGKAVIGGFANTDKDLLYKGNKEEIESATEQLISKAGKKGIILGADCTVPSDIELSRLEWVRKKAARV